MPDWLEGWFRQHRWGAPLVVTIGLLLVVDGVAGGFGVLRSVFDWIKSLSEVQEPAPVPQLELVNLDMRAGSEIGNAQSEGLNLVTLKAVLQNPGSEPVFVVVSDVDANLGVSSCEKNAVAWNTLPLPRGLRAEASLCNISTSIQPGDYAHGRIDVRLRYGFNRDDLDRELRIKGELVADGTTRQVAWAPDGDSAFPAKMVPRLTVRQPGQSVAEAIAETKK